MRRVTFIAILAITITFAALAAPRGDRPASASGGTVKLVGNLPGTPPAATTQAVPDRASQDRAYAVIKEVYGAELDATDPSAQLALSRKLLQQAADTRDDVPLQFVLYRLAREKAAFADEPRAVITAIDEMAKTFPVGACDMTITVLRQMASKVDSFPALEALVHTALSAMESAAARDDFDAAQKLGAFAEEMAKRPHKGGQLNVEAQGRIKEVQSQRRDCLAAAAAARVLQQQPNDADAKLTVGRCACFIKGDFDRGLPLLAGGADPKLKSLADKDLSRPLDAATQSQLADEWWDLAQKQPPLAKINLQSRAARWYQRAAPSLTSVVLDQANKRILEADTAFLKRQGLAPGLAAELFEGENFAKLVMTRVDPQINFDWNTAAPAEGMPKDDFAIRWTGRLKVPRAGKYLLIVTANSGAKLVIDGKTLVDNDDLTRKRNGERVPVEFSEGLHAFRLDFHDGGGEANVKLQWITPAGGKEEPIPAGAFWHEGSP